MDAWAAKDPLENFTEFLRNEGILSEKDEVKMKEEILHEINENLDIAFAEAKIIPSESEELIKDLTEEEVNNIRKMLDAEGVLLEGELQRAVLSNIKRHREIGTWRGLRHGRHMPVRGQRTKSNFRRNKGNG